jgi:homoserine acetyltransferase
MITNSHYTQDVHGPYELHDIGYLELEEGGAIRNCQLAYATFGTLNAAKDNAILFPPGTRAQTRSSRRYLSARGVRSTPQSISS